VINQRYKEVHRTGTGAAMSIKKKLLLIAVCVVIIIVVFTVNVLQKVREDNQENNPEEAAVETTISRAEAFRLLSYLEYDKSEREAIPLEIAYAQAEMSGWYDDYVNAVWKMGLIEKNITVKPTEALTYGTCKELIDKLILNKPELQEVYQKLNFNFTNADQSIPTREFLELYEDILTAVPEEDRLYTYETLLVLGRDVTEDEKDRMVTDRGKYYYLDALSYETFLGQDAPENNTATGVPGTPTATLDTGDVLTEDPAKASGEETEDSQTVAASNSVSENTETSLIDRYMDQGIRVLTCGQEIVYVTAVSSDKIVIHNVWIKHGEGITVDTFVNGIDKSFTAQLKLSSSLDKVIGDITMADRKVVQISVKPDMIHGKVLRTGSDFVEIEGYGEIPLEEDYKIYKIYGTLSMEPTGSILVGYENTDFIVSGGKISAALITESIKAENIRVLLKTTDYKSNYHEKVEFTATEDFTVSYGENSDTYTSGETVSVEPGDAMIRNGRITVKTATEEGKIELLSLERSSGHPKYRGTIEIAEDENGLLVVNELPLEEYLYAVLPSEMPTNYGTEALKVQAVCARSYAYKHLLSNSLSDYGAHVDDSVTYQVYNNIAENEDSILASKDTYGKIVEYDGNVIDAYYFSTSCGHTALASQAWANNIELPYLDSKLLLTEDSQEVLGLQETVLKKYTDLSSEDNFRSFLETDSVSTYDSSFGWYRWKVTISAKDLKRAIDSNLAGRYNANPELILTKTGTSEDGEDIFESIPVDTVGSVVDITILKRESSGLISELLITGSDNTVKVEKEYNIRVLLAPVYDKVERQDGSVVENLNLLPSAFFFIDKKEKSSKLSSITITGGGYGHGVGVSQNGVKAMADAGKDYEEILNYFYKDTEIGFIYE
jgi:stage II sporulation protein D